MGTSASLFFQKAHGFSTGLTGVGLSGIFIASAISNPLFGRLSDRGRIRWLAGLLTLAALLILAFPRVPAGWAVPVLLTYGFFFMASYPVTEAALMEAVPDAVRGRVFGLFITISGLIGNVAHWAMGDWVGRMGGRASEQSAYYTLYTMLAVLVLASLGALPFLRAIRNREQLLGSRAL
jgi:MFS family permease